jgi:chromate transporter
LVESTIESSFFRALLAGNASQREMSVKSTYKELASLFIKLGLTAFGGPSVHIAMMQREVVDKRGWMDHAQFLDLLSATQLIPGPNSTEMAIYIGLERGGWKGLCIAGFFFICPAVLITAGIAWLYQKYGQLPQVSSFAYGVQPAIIPVICAATIPLARRALKGWGTRGIALGALVAGVSGISGIYILLGAGLMALIIGGTFSRASKASLFIHIPAYKLFFIFLKVGAILYGSGYVLFAFLNSELVSTGILPQKVLMDAIAVGQFTPGPVLSAVTFIGWQMSGWETAAIATLGVFLPAFAFVVLSHLLLPKLQKLTLFNTFLSGVNAASVALILTVCIAFGQHVLQDWRATIIGVLASIAVFVFKKLNSAIIVLGGALLGYLMSFA